jgi:hypothetical protein
MWYVNTRALYACNFSPVKKTTNQWLHEISCFITAPVTYFFKFVRMETGPKNVKERHPTIPAVISGCLKVRPSTTVAGMPTQTLEAYTEN